MLDLLLLLALAVAVGIDLPLVLLLPSLLALLPGAGVLPSEWLPLATPGPALLGLILYLAGWGVRRIPGLRALHEGLVALAALPAAALLVLLFGPPTASLPPLLLMVLAAGVAGILQAGRLGSRLLDRVLPDRPRIPAPLAREAIEDGTVLVLMAGAMVLPHLAGPAAALLLAGFLWGGRPALRASRFLPILAAGILRHLTHPGSGWRGPSGLPRWVLPAESADGEASPRTRGSTDASAPPSGLRGTRAALVGPAPVGVFRSGWLVWDGASPLFVYRTLARTWEVELGPAGESPTREAPPAWGRQVPVDLGEGPGWLLLPLDGPPNVEDRIREAGTRSGF